MPTTGLKGAYLLTTDKINEVVAKTLPGAYALGTLSPDRNMFYVYYIGRSDDDINGRLKQHAGHKYTHFKFDYFSTSKSAFEKECRLWHEWGGGRGALDNAIHPSSPEGANYRCPICVFG